MDDERAIGEIVDAFFAAFTSGPGLADRVDRLRGLFLPQAMVIRTCGDLATYDVEGFLAPRLELLSGGTLTGFREWATDGRTEVYGDVAHHWCGYAKSWTQDDALQEGRGAKTMQLVRTDDGWRIAAVAWDDER